MDEERGDGRLDIYSYCRGLGSFAYRDVGGKNVVTF